MTEEEAKTKWCPFAHMFSSSGSFNRNQFDSPMTRCIGSQCMVWRWDKASINERGQLTEGRCGY